MDQDILKSIELAKLYEKQAEEYMAEDNQQEAIDAKALLYGVLKEISDHYEKTGDFKSALEYYKKYNAVKEDVLNAETEEGLKLKNLELKQAYQHIEEKNRDFLDSIRYAYRIQKAISPPQKLVDELLPQSFILYKPKDVVSGDFYFVSKLKDKVVFAAVDCTGHGVPGALMSVIGYNWLVQGVSDAAVDTPGKLLTFLDAGVNETLRQTADESGVKDSMDLAVCMIDYKTNTLMYSGAYNPCYYISKGEFNEIKADKFPIGVNTDGVVDIYSENSVQLYKGDTVYIFSDGYADQFGGPKGKKFKYKQMKEIIESIQDKSMQEQGAILDKAFVEWQGNEEQVDDILVIGVKL